MSHHLKHSGNPQQPPITLLVGSKYKKAQAPNCWFFCEIIMVLKSMVQKLG